VKRFLTKLTRWDQALLALVAVYLLLWPLEQLYDFVFTLRSWLQAALYLVGSVVLIRRLIALFRLLLRRFLWRVRHRMIAVFFFVGVVPLTLALFATAWGAIVLFGPIASYVVTSRIEERSAALHAAIESVGWQLQASPASDRAAIGRSFFEEGRRTYPGMMVRVEMPQGPVGFPDSFRDIEPPERLRTHRGLVRWGGQLYLSAYPRFDERMPAMLVVVPLTPEYLRELAPGLGFVEPIDAATAMAAARAADPGAARRAFARTVRAVDRPEASARSRPVQRDVPDPVHPLDWTLRWTATVKVFEWETGETLLEPALMLYTRPSAVVRLMASSQSDAMVSMARVLGAAITTTFGITLLISLIVAVSLTRTVTEAVHALYLGTLHVHRADFSHRIPLQGRNQLTELARSFNTMTESIEHLIEEQKEKQRLEAELALAHEVQAQLLPSETPRLESLEVLGVSHAARQVSGDFFDYVKLSPTRVSITFGDVSGKGPSAALVMSAIHSIVRAQLGGVTAAGANGDLAEATARLATETNRQLHANTPADKFATLFFGVYDQDLSTLAYANAGHLPPLLVRNGEAIPLEVTGMVAGAFSEAAYGSSIVELRPGDLVAAFTDGVTEPENPYGEDFGEERLAEVLIREADRSIEEIIAAVLREVEEWTGQIPELSDDMTMLIARRL